MSLSSSATSLTPFYGWFLKASPSLEIGLFIFSSLAACVCVWAYWCAHRCVCRSNKDIWIKSHLCRAVAASSVMIYVLRHSASTSHQSRTGPHLSSTLLCIRLSDPREATVLCFEMLRSGYSNCSSCLVSSFFSFLSWLQTQNSHFCVASSGVMKLKIEHRVRLYKHIQMNKCELNNMCDSSGSWTQIQLQLALTSTVLY